MVVGAGDVEHDQWRLEVLARLDAHAHGGAGDDRVVDGNHDPLDGGDGAVGRPSEHEHVARRRVQDRRGDRTELQAIVVLGGGPHHQRVRTGVPHGVQNAAGDARCRGGAELDARARQTVRHRLDQFLQPADEASLRLGVAVVHQHDAGHDAAPLLAAGQQVGGAQQVDRGIGVRQRHDDRPCGAPFLGVVPPRAGCHHPARGEIVDGRHGA